MKKAISLGLTAIMLLAAAGSYADENQATKKNQMRVNPKATHLSIGVDMTKFNSDYGMGLSITSPAFANGYMAVRAHGGVSVLNGLPENATEYDIMNYQSVRLGFVVSVGMLGGLARFYSEPGLLVQFPDEWFSDDIATGGYGLIGFECFTAEKSPVTYFLQAGGYGTSGNADKLSGKPGWGSGYLFEVGVRWYL